MSLWSFLFGPARSHGPAAPSAAQPTSAAPAVVPPTASPGVSAAGLALIKRFEGLRLTAYRDAAGNLTIGYGHLIQPGERFAHGIDGAEAAALLAADLRAAEAAVARLAAVPLSQGQRDALVSFVFNLGAARLAGSTLLKKLNAGDGLGACQEFVRWIHAGGRPLKGLLRRRLAEAALFLED